MSHDELRIKDLCPDLGKPWWRVPHLLKLNALLIAPFLTSYVGGYDGSVLNGMQTVPVWQDDFHHPKGGILGLMVTMQVIGGIACLPFAPFAADIFGRRHPVAFGSVLTVFGAALQGGATNLGMFIAGRFFIGVGGSFAAVSAAPLIAELSYPTHRAIFTAVYNTSWYLGSIVAAWVTYGTFAMPNSWSWRIPSLLQALVSVIQIFTIYVVPESPRWLIANDRTEEASRILSKYHAGSDEPSELVRFEVAEITAAIEFERANKSTSFLQFFRTKGNIHRFAITVLLGFIIQWCGNSLISSYLILILNNIGITDPETQNLINGGLQIYNMVVATTAACLVDRLGRRFLFLLSTIGMMFSFVIWIILSARNQQLNYEKKGLGIGVVVMVFVFYAFYNFAMNPLPIAYLVEVLPYTLRAKGLTIFNLAQFSSSLFNGFVNPVGMEALGWRYYIVFACALALWLIIIYFLFPETRGMSLEEVSQVFDGKEALARTHDVKQATFAEGDHLEHIVGREEKA
ncbi:hypothetical protein NW759_007937 [Fusarium solani]|uniref:General substrate transporter n=1 Tax=Fusarium solani TaxID=169388 RepID=A0A9P9GXT0_FUSSL|nr:general substrate transporter [Fusarium solani]KAH7247171.1 general substrate transporter [Fusarium solani]KAJ4219549.1 hypothetical protein NW759_007937 [Fusarium solani]